MKLDIGLRDLGSIPGRVIPVGAIEKGAFGSTTLGIWMKMYNTYVYFWTLVGGESHGIMETVASK